MIRYSLSINKNTQTRFDGKYIKYEKYEIDTIDYTGGANDRYLVIKFHCDKSLENEKFFNDSQTIITETYPADAGQVYSNRIECKLVKVNHSPYFIEGVIPYRNKLTFYHKNISETDKKLYIRLKEAHCFKDDTTEKNAYLKVTNQPEITCKVNYVDDYTISVNEGDYDRVLFEGLSDYDFEYIERDSFIMDADSVYLPSYIRGYYIELPFLSSSILKSGGAFIEKIGDRKKEVVSFYTETEKDMYNLVSKKDGVFLDVLKLQLNLHLLKRYGESWLLNKTSLWNGVNPDYTFDKDYFPQNANKSEYADLLGKLGFTDEDVLYSKSNLKKSFVRLSFYDSPSLEHGQLLAYNTITFNERLFLNKLIKHRHKGRYKEYRGEEVGYKERTGISVNSTPIVYDKNENNKLSCEFVVEKNNPMRGSEGINLYLHKLFNNDLSEKDVYLRIELNHAKFGRTIPLMLPYNVANGNVKTFEEIVKDHERGNGYTLNDFNKFFNIKIKIKNDQENNRYVYYLDTDLYKGISDSNGVVTLNLYEGKVSSINSNTEVNDDIVYSVSDYKLKYSKKIIDKDDNIVLFTPTVSYKLKGITNRTKRLINDKRVISKQSKYNIELNQLPIEIINATKVGNDIKNFVEVGRMYLLKHDLRDYSLYTLTEFNADKLGVDLCSIIVSNVSGKIEVKGLERLKRELRLADKFELAKVVSKDIVDGTPYVSQEQVIVI